MKSHYVIQRKMQYILTDADDNLLVLDLKRIIESILNIPPENQRLYYRGKMLDDKKTLSVSGLSHYFASAHSPACIGLALKMENGEFEKLELTPYPMVPEMPIIENTPYFCIKPKDKSCSDGDDVNTAEPSSSGKPKSKRSGKKKSSGTPRRKTTH